MRRVSVVGRILEIFGAALLLVAALLGAILFQPTPGAWFGDFPSLRRDMQEFLGTLGLIGAAAILFGFRLVRKGAAAGNRSNSRDEAATEK